MQYALKAAHEALENANWFPESEQERNRTGVCIGSGIGNIDDLFDTSILFHQHVSLSS